MVRQAIDRSSLSAMVDELTKMGSRFVKPPSILKALTSGSSFSSNALKPSSIKHVVPTAGSKAGRVLPTASTSGRATSLPGVRGANIRTPTTVDPKMPLVKGTPPASPVHAAPKSIHKQLLSDKGRHRR